LGKATSDESSWGKLRADGDLFDGINEIVKKKGIRAGVILSVVGALKRATFRNLILLPTNLKMDDQHRLYLDLEQPIELVSLTGWITNKEGE